MYSFNDFRQWINTGNEIEFTINNKHYSVTYGIKENGEKYISFCEFYKQDTEFSSANDFMENAKIDGILLSKLWDKAEDIEIY